MRVSISLVSYWIRVISKSRILSRIDKSAALMDPVRRKSTTSASFFNRSFSGRGLIRHQSESLDEVQGRCLEDLSLIASSHNILASLAQPLTLVARPSRLEPTICALGAPD